MKFCKSVYSSFLYEFFHENTSLNKFNICSLNNNISVTYDNDDFKSNCFLKPSLYRKFTKTVQLSSPQTYKNVDLYYSLTRRRSKRGFTASAPLNKQTFSNVVYYSFGIGEYCDGFKSKTKKPLYFYPTAGGLNSIHVFIVVNNIEDIPNAMYLYDPFENVLREVSKFNAYNEYINISGSWELSLHSYFSIHLVADLQFSVSKYGDRAYRFSNIEVGHCMQNLYLVSTANNLDVVASGGFLDGEFFSYFSIEENDLFLLYEGFVGACR